MTDGSTHLAGPAGSDHASRLRVDVHVRPGASQSTLAHDVREGLAQRPYSLPPKHFYDDVGSRLFDQICDTPEYYLTRAETALLERLAPGLIAEAKPATLVELGSGAARKTRLLLDAFVRAAPEPCYVPLDLSESMLRRSAHALLAQYPTLAIHGVVGDYERHLAAAPRDGRRLVVFLGSTIGNLAPAAAARFLSALARQLAPDDRLLLGVDLVKARAVIDRAYNDTAGLTAAFNRNVLAVVNRELGGDFDPLAFDHVAFYAAADAQVEMHLRARRGHVARVSALGLEVPLGAGETIHTEISRKFTRQSTEATLVAGGFVPLRWEQTRPGDGPAFGLALARVAG